MEGKGKGCASALLQLGAPCHSFSSTVAAAMAVVIILPSDVSVPVRLCKQPAFPGEGALPEAHEVPPSPTLHSLLLSLLLLSQGPETHLPLPAPYNGLRNDTLLNLQNDQCS